MATKRGTDVGVCPLLFLYCVSRHVLLAFTCCMNHQQQASTYSCGASMSANATHPPNLQQKNDIMIKHVRMITGEGEQTGGQQTVTDM